MSLDPVLETEFELRRMCIFALWTCGLLLVEVMEERHCKAQGTAEETELCALESCGGVNKCTWKLYIECFLFVCASGWACLTVLATPESTQEEGQASCFLLRDAAGSAPRWHLGILWTRLPWVQPGRLGGAGTRNASSLFARGCTVLVFLSMLWSTDVWITEVYSWECEKRSSCGSLRL